MGIVGLQSNFKAVLKQKLDQLITRFRVLPVGGKSDIVSLQQDLKVSHEWEISLITTCQTILTCHFLLFFFSISRHKLSVELIFK